MNAVARASAAASSSPRCKMSPSCSLSQTTEDKPPPVLSLLLIMHLSSKILNNQNNSKMTRHYSTLIIQNTHLDVLVFLFVLERNNVLSVGEQIQQKIQQLFLSPLSFFYLFVIKLTIFILAT